MIMVVVCFIGTAGLVQVVWLDGSTAHTKEK